MKPSPIRALVIEDDDSWNQILTEILSDHGFEVDSATNLHDAIEMIRSQAHRLAVVDLSLSPKNHNNMDGLQVLQAARLLDPNCRTILLTGFATVELAVSSITNYNAFTFLRKESFSRGQFRDIINKILLSAPVSSSQNLTNTNTRIGMEFNQSPNSLTMPDRSALIIDDDAGWRSILSEQLIELGLNVITCASFGDALGHLRREKFNLAIVDMSLAGVGTNLWSSNSGSKNLEGYQVLAATKIAKVTTIVVSGIASSDEIEKVYSQQSVFAYLEKQTFDRNIFRNLVLESLKENQISDELDVLTERELDVFKLLAQGMTNKEIADKLMITTNTVKRHLKAIFEKLNVHTRSAAASKAVKKG